jgi:hypothetical protein
MLRPPRPASRPTSVRSTSGYLDGLGMKAEAEIRRAEDALIASIEEQSKRDRPYAPADRDLANRYQLGAKDAPA